MAKKSKSQRRGAALGALRTEHLHVALAGLSIRVPAALATVLLLCGSALIALTVSLLAALLFAGVITSADVVDMLQAIHAGTVTWRR